MKKFISNYTKDTAKAIKAAEKLFCTVTEDGAIYLCSGYWMYKMTAEEYAAIAQPVTHCDAGNWTIDGNGKHDGDTGHNMVKIFTDAANAAEGKPVLIRCPLSLERSKLFAYLYHSPDNFVAAYDRRYISSVCNGQTFRAPGASSPAVFYNANNDPFALIMPIRLNAKDTRAIMAYYTEPAEEDTPKAQDNTELLNTARALEAERDNLQEALDLALKHGADQAAELEALRAKVAELEALHNNATQQPQEAAAAPQQPAQCEAKTAAELIAARFTGFAGVTATIKGAQTAAPVIWLSGETTKHAEAIKAAGAKWSGKRGAFYVRVA